MSSRTRRAVAADVPVSSTGTSDGRRRDSSADTWVAEIVEPGGDGELRQQRRHGIRRCLTLWKAKPRESPERGHGDQNRDQQQPRLAREARPRRTLVVHPGHANDEVEDRQEKMG